ncbi:glycosyltransferase family protein [Candidatus Peregrinibacteria bacterium]|nr:glycosyltransferase family protein [Candidatus Peregrinibacteria bacterium]
MKIVAIIQARMSSTRLPEKVLADIGGRPMLYRVVERVRLTPAIAEVIVATSTDASDEPIALYCKKQGFSCFRGDLSDVLARYYHAARAYRADVIVRITADCPLHDPAVIQKVVRAFDPQKHDYVSNVLPPTYPDGLDTEVFSFATLERMHTEAVLPSEREHVTFYITNHPECFRIHNVPYTEDLHTYRWVVDRPQDLVFAQAVYSHFGEKSFGMEDILALLREQPELCKLNEGIQRNEGHAAALQADHEYRSHSN